MTVSFPGGGRYEGSSVIKGYLDASSDTISALTATAESNDTYQISIAGDFGGSADLADPNQTFKAGDRVAFDFTNTNWVKIDATDLFETVAGKTKLIEDGENIHFETRSGSLSPSELTSPSDMFLSGGVWYNKMTLGADHTPYTVESYTGDYNLIPTTNQGGNGLDIDDDIDITANISNGCRMSDKGSLYGWDIPVYTMVLDLATAQQLGAVEFFCGLSSGDNYVDYIKVYGSNSSDMSGKELCSSEEDQGNGYYVSGARRNTFLHGTAAYRYYEIVIKVHQVNPEGSHTWNMTITELDLVLGVPVTGGNGGDIVAVVPITGTQSVDNSSLVVSDGGAPLADPDVTVDYALNGGAYTLTPMTLAAFIALPSDTFANLTALDIKIFPELTATVDTLTLTTAVNGLKLGESGGLDYYYNGVVVASFAADGTLTADSVDISAAAVAALAHHAVVGSSPHLIAWRITTTTDTAVNGDQILADTSGGTYIQSFPPTPSVGDVVRVKDYSKTFQTNKLTMGGNGKKINDVLADMDITSQGADVTFVYTTAKGWVS